MKNLFYIALTATGLFVASCASNSKDDSDSPAPATDPRDRYVSHWNVSENSAVSGTSTHTVNINKSTTNSNEIIIDNFSGLSVSARASVNNNNLIIPYQQIGSIGFTQGSGTFNGSNSISMNYTTTISTSRDSCHATYTK